MTDAKEIEEQAYTREWSGRHVRLKYQMFASAVLLYSISVYKIKKFNHFGFFEVEKIPTQTVVEMFLCLFFIFTLISFIIKTVNENAKTANIITLTSNSLDETKSAFKTMTKEVVGFTEPKYLVPNFELEQFREKLQNQIDSINSQIGIIKKLADSPIPIGTNRKIRKEFSEQILKLMSEKNLKENELSSEAKSFYYNVREIGDINDIPINASLLENPLKELKSLSIEIKTTTSQYESKISKLDDFFSHHIEGRITNIENDFQSLSKSIATVISRNEKFNQLNSIERNLLSVTLPILASTIIAILGIWHSDIINNYFSSTAG